MSIINSAKKPKYLLFLLLVLFSAESAADVVIERKDPAKDEDNPVQQQKKGRLPVIIIPGLTGSELINQKTGETAWFSIARQKDDDLRLPVSPMILNNRDDLVAGDILRSIKVSRFLPGVRIYKGLIESLEKDGYTEGKIDEPPVDGFEDTFYVFPYDWRRDNVENAHLLLQKLDKLRAKVKRPKLRFNIVAHSMGGLIARYAAMHGKRDLADKMTGSAWKGEGYFNNLSLVGVPNGGSLLVLDSLLNGMSLLGSFKVNIPFVMDLTKYDVFTIPSIYQLLPHEGLLRVYDENLKEIDVDIYNSETWKKYGWLAYGSKEFGNEFSAKEATLAEEYFQTVLRRAKLFQSALNSSSNQNTSVRIYNFGAECIPTVDGMVIYKESKTDNWRTLFLAESFKKSDGTTVSKKRVEEVNRWPGDGQVSQGSLNHSFTKTRKTNQSTADVKELTIVCGYHSLLVEHNEIQKGIMRVLNLPPNHRKRRPIR